MKTQWVLFLTFLLFAFTRCSSNSGMDEDPSENDEGRVAVHVTSLDGSTTLNELSTKLPFTERDEGTIVEISGTDKGPAIEGFGAALTGSSAWLLNKNPEAIKALFSEEEIGLSYVRLTVGASDFNKNGSYTYNDINEPEDLDLSGFSIEEDKTTENPVIPIAQAILAQNSAVRFMASPWTPPAWMKSSKSFIGGSLLPQYYDVYADYFVKYIQAYQAEGINISAVTPQNEPLYEPATYPGMGMSALEQADFIGKHLGPKLAQAGLATNIIAYDHNFYEGTDPDYPITVLSNVEAAKHTNDVAYHAYGGQASDVDKLLDRFPGAGIYFTEQTGIQTEETTFRGEIVWFMNNVFVPLLRRGAKTILLWNLALDENGGPTNDGCKTCRGVVTITSAGNMVKNPDYYLLGHFSKFVKPGAVRLGTGEFAGKFENVAFQNPDGSQVLVLLNSGSTDQLITVKPGSQGFQYTLPANSLVTLVWEAA